MRLSVEQRIRMVYLYVEHDLAMRKNKYAILKELAFDEGIEISKLTLFKTIQK